MKKYLWLGLGVLVLVILIGGIFLWKYDNSPSALVNNPGAVSSPKVDAFNSGNFT